MKIPVIGQSFESFSVDVDTQRTVNWYVEQAPSGKNQMVLIPTPGLTTFGTAGSGALRAAIVMGSFLYVVSGNTFYKVDSGGLATSKGTIGTSSGRVEMAHNGTQVLLVDGAKAYKYDATYDTIAPVDAVDTGTTTATTANKLVDSGATFVTDGIIVGTRVFNTTDSTTAIITAVDSETTLSVSSDIFTTGEGYEIGDYDFPSGATTLTFIDGYFAVNDPNNTNGSGVPGAFFISSSYDGTQWAALDFGVASRSWDQITALRKANGQLWAVGEESTEVFYNSGNADFPFDVVPSAVIEWGAIAGATVAEAQNQLIWLSKTKYGQGMVVMSNGYNVERISHHGLENAFVNYTDLSASFGFVFQWKGHIFYVLTFTTDNKTWMYDMTSGVWTEWSTSGIDNRHDGNCYAYFNGKHLVGDKDSGKIYQLSDTVYKDDATAITRFRQTPHIHAEDKKLFARKLNLQFEQGVANGDVSDPQVMLQWSDDGGHNWSNEYWRDILGETGQYSLPSQWRRLGAFRDRVFRIKVTDAVKAVLIDGYLDVDAGEDLHG